MVMILLEIISVDDIEMISIVIDGTAATKPKRASANRSSLPDPKLESLANSGQHKSQRAHKEVDCCNFFRRMNFH